MKKNLFKAEIKSIEFLNTTAGRMYQIYLLLEGKAHVDISGQTSILHRGQCFILNPQEILTITQKPAALFFTVSLNLSQLQSLISQFDTQNFVNFPQGYQDISAFKNILQQLMVDELSRKLSSAEHLEAVLRIYNFMTNHFTRQTQVDFSLTKHPNTRIRHIFNFIESHFDQELNLNVLATQEHLSYTYLSKYFKQVTGQRFNGYLNEVRLRHAVKDLQFTNKKILQVALDNGFSHPKTFNRNFQRFYRTTPKDYRRQYRQENIGQPKISSNSQKVKTFTKEAALNRLTGYLIGNNLEASYVQNRQKFKLDLKQTVDGELAVKHASFTINLGAAVNLLKIEYIQELDQVRSKLHFKYLRIFGSGWEMLPRTQSYVIAENKELLLIYQRILEYGALPIIHFSRELLEAYKADDVYRYFTIIKGHFGSGAIQKWIFEFDEDCLDLTVIPEFLTQLKHIQIGLHLTNLTAVPETLNKVARIKHHISMIACDYVFMNEDISQDYLKLKAQLQPLLNYLHRIPVSPEISLTEWNTLTGQDGRTMGTFFRAALVKEILRKNSFINDFSLWLSIPSKNNFTGKIEDSSLSLYLYDLIRRPMFFVLDFWQRLQGRCLLEQVQLSVFQQGETLLVLVSNPSFLEPSMSISKDLVEYQSVAFNIELVNLPTKKYQIKSYLLDKDHGGIYNDWLRTGSPRIFDSEVSEFLATKVQPELKVWQSDRQTKTLRLETTLSLNGLHYFVVQPFE